MYFPVNTITKPLMYHLVRDFNLQINILHADISLNRTGKLIADFEGEETELDKGLEFINSQGIEYKIFNKSIIWQEGSCVHCGACTAVCPTGALRMDVREWTLTFEREKCLVCGLCVNACPLNVMSLSDNGI